MDCVPAVLCPSPRSLHHCTSTSKYQSIRYPCQEILVHMLTGCASQASCHMLQKHLAVPISPRHHRCEHIGWSCSLHRAIIDVNTHGHWNCILSLVIQANKHTIKKVKLSEMNQAAATSCSHRFIRRCPLLFMHNLPALLFTQYDSSALEGQFTGFEKHLMRPSHHTTTLADTQHKPPPHALPLYAH